MANEEIDGEELQRKIDRYGDMLYKLGMVKLQNVQDAEDVVQEVFYQYIKRDMPFESEEHEKAWLLTVAMNACRKQWRSAWRRHRKADAWQDTAEPDGRERVPADREETPEEVLLKREENSRLLGAVMALPAKYRDVIHLFYYQELSVKEISHVTGRGESTVTSQLTRGRELLRKSLKEEYDFE